MAHKLSRVNRLFTEVVACALLTNQQVRGETRLQPRDKALQKLVTRDATKPGELSEIIEVINDGSRGAVADELADCVYYAVQLDVHPIGELVLPRLTSVIEALGFTTEEALQFAQIKYQTRLEYGKDKAREQTAIDNFVASLPDRPEDRARALTELSGLRAWLLGE